MGIFSGIFERKYDTYSLFTELFGSKKSATGKTVNINTAIDVSTVFACCRVIGEGIAQTSQKHPGA